MQVTEIKKETLPCHFQHENLLLVHNNFITHSTPLVNKIGATICIYKINLGIGKATSMTVSCHVNNYLYQFTGILQYNNYCQFDIEMTEAIDSFTCNSFECLFEQKNV